MSISKHAGLAGRQVINGPQAMVEAVLEIGIIPFFANAVRGYSIEEMTPAEHWFDSDDLGPWDWKIECVQSGQIAYGKFLYSGKASFASVEFYRELMNYRRSLPKYQAAGPQITVLDYVQEHGDITIKEVRSLLGVKKAAADNVIAKLQQQTRLVTGDFQRVYRGPDLHYSGWQTASFTTPEAMFSDSGETKGPGGFPFAGEPRALDSGHTPAESLEILCSRISSLFPNAGERDLMKILG